MYYISQETYDQLPDQFQEKALGDTRKYYKQHGVPLPSELITGAEADKKPSFEATQEGLMDEKRKIESEMKGEEKSKKKMLFGGDSEEEADSPKTWDDAHKKGIALIISMGKPEEEEGDE